MEDFTPALVKRHDHARVTAGQGDSFRRDFSAEDFGVKLAVIAAEKQRFLVDPARNFKIGCESDRQNFKIIGYPLGPGWKRQTVTDDIVEAIDFVAKNPAFRTEYIAVTEAGSLEGPVLGQVNRKATGTEGNATAPARIDSANRVQPEGQCTGAVDLREFPTGGNPPGIKLWIFAFGARLVTNLASASAGALAFPFHCKNSSMSSDCTTWQ